MRVETSFGNFPVGEDLLSIVREQIDGILEKAEAEYEDTPQKDLLTLPERDQRDLARSLYILDQPSGRYPLMEDPNGGKNSDISARLGFLDRYFGVAAESAERNRNFVYEAVVKSQNLKGDHGVLIARIDAKDPRILNKQRCGFWDFRGMQEYAQKPVVGVESIRKEIPASKTNIVPQAKAVETGGFFRGIGKVIKRWFGSSEAKVQKKPPLSRLAVAVLVGNVF